MVLSNLEKAEKDRDAAAATIKWTETKVKTATTPLSRVQIDHHLANLAKLQEDVNDIHRRIVTCKPSDDELKAHTGEYFKLLDLLSELQCELKTSRAASATATTSSSSGGPPSADIKLPKMEVPSFDGTLIDWLSFSDMFKATIHNNSKLSDVQRLSYLKSFLTGEAARQIKSVVLSDANYSVAWKLLEDRYHNDRELLFSVLRRFTGQHVIQTPSANALRSLIDTSKECQRALEGLKLPIKHWDAIVLFHIHQKLDSTTRELWEQTLTGSSIPKLSDFMDYLEQRARALAAGGQISTSKSQGGRGEGSAGRRQAQTHHVQTAFTCSLCSGDHLMHRCSKFLQKTIDERIAYVRQKNLCYNCLRDGHSKPNCLSKGTCRTCQQQHHTVLHRPINSSKNDKPPPTASTSSQGTTGNVPPVSYFTNDENSIAQSILATAVVHIQDHFGTIHSCRVLLDGGSTASFISEACVQKLGLSRKYSNTAVIGLSSTPAGTTRGTTTFKMTPHFQSNDQFVVNAFILQKVTGQLPGFECDPSVWPHIRGLQLADPNFHKPADVDILLGAELFYNIILNGQRVGTDTSPAAIRTSLGWLVAGEILERFWKIEDVTPATTTIMTEDEQLCDNHFKSTYSREESGRFIVRLPFKSPPIQLGASRDIAIRRLKSLERRLQQNPAHYQEYINFLREYKHLGHMSEIPFPATYTGPHCYIPHHFVQKQSSTSTKFRVVFDASSATTSGNSLNSSLMIGATLQDNLCDLLLRFRKHAIAFTADIAKMYRQVRVSPDDCQFQRIVWRENPADPIKEYLLETVTYGTACAPYLATRVLNELASAEGKDFPISTPILENDFYVDDCMSGADTELAALQAQQQLIDLLKRGGFDLRKWASNSESLLSSLPESQREVQSLHSFNHDTIIKTLGINWNPRLDEFSFKVTHSNLHSSQDFTKREILSEIAKLYDPLGWLAPIIIAAKILMQEIWKTTLGWDDKLPAQLQQKWNGFRQEMKNIEQYSIPRFISCTNVVSLDLIGFCDASQLAYSGVLYVRAIDGCGYVKVSLLTSKTRVAPAKTVTLPRLELCGALLLAELISTTKRALKMDFREVTAWTDSTITLAWIRGHPSRWQTFVQNRVTKIQSHLSIAHWRHTPGKDNPADCASRGLKASELISHPLWWNGTEWMRAGVFPDTTSTMFNTCEEERKNVTCHTAQVSYFSTVIQRYSSYKTLIRIFGWCFRFIHNSKHKEKLQRQGGPLLPDEMERALTAIVRTVQGESFHSEHTQLTSKTNLHSRSKLYQFSTKLH